MNIKAKISVVLTAALVVFTCNAFAQEQKPDTASNVVPETITVEITVLLDDKVLTQMNITTLDGTTAPVKVEDVNGYVRVANTRGKLKAAQYTVGYAANITPKFEDDGKISVLVEQKISQLAEMKTSKRGERVISSPQITSRTDTRVVTVENGQSETIKLAFNDERFTLHITATKNTL